MVWQSIALGLFPMAWHRKCSDQESGLLGINCILGYSMPQSSPSSSLAAAHVASCNVLAGFSFDFIKNPHNKIKSNNAGT